MTGRYLQVITTIGSQEEARSLARHLIDRKLAACAQVIGPIESHYTWEEVVEADQEWMLVIKTTNPAYPALEEAITARHPYDTPEIVACPITRGSGAYLGWIDEQVPDPS